MGLSDFRESVAKYYDLAPHHPDDIPFYRGRILSLESHVLELGCGTGRVSIPLLEHCTVLHGIDHSDSMLDLLRSKVAAGFESRLRLTRGDISDFDLGETFDLVIAPFRVIQNLETEAQFSGLLRSIRIHLAPGGRCVLNAFRPKKDRDGIIATWATGEEQRAWEVETNAGRVACYDRRVRVQSDPLVVYPELIYRRSVDGKVVDEAVLKIAMRCFYPDEFVARIESAGFRVTNTWGGYAGEAYGVGPELVVEFTMDARDQL